MAEIPLNTIPGGEEEQQGEEEQDGKSQMKNRFEAALQTWYEIGLTQLQQRLDKEGIEIVENQKSALQSRKELANRTKEFRKLSDEEKLVHVKGLLKGYQAEIDTLTRKCKCAETYFLNIYKLLAEAPDPYPLLENTLDNYVTSSQVSQLEQENARLKAELLDYNNVKQQLKDVVEAKDKEFQVILEEKQNNWATQEMMLQNMVDESRQQLKQVRESRLLENNEGELNNNDDDDDAAHRAEVELIAHDLQRVNEIVSQLENRNLALRKEIEQYKNNDNNNNNNNDGGDNQQVEDLTQEIASVRRQYDKCVLESQKEKLQLNAQIKVLQQDIARTSQESKALKEKISLQEDYNEVKRELEILKVMEFSQDDDDDDDGERQQQESLEQLLLLRNNKLVAQLAALREGYDELAKTFEEVKITNQNMERELKATKQSAKQMENDLLNIDSKTVTGGSRWGGGARSSWGGRLSPTSSIIGGGGEVSSSSDSLLPIITHQRDRFRQRNGELEEEVKENFHQISELGAQVERLKQENVNLIEQTRYQQHYRGTTSTSGSSSNNTAASTRNYYEDEYQDQLSPYKKFQSNQYKRKISNMNIIEKIIYTFSKIILKSKYSRNFFFIYCISLHLLIMIMIWYLAFNTTSTTTVSSDLPIVNNGNIRLPE